MSDFQNPTFLILRSDFLNIHVGGVSVNRFLYMAKVLIGFSPFSFRGLFKMNQKIFNIISLGAGVQSSTMALMAAKRRLLPMPDAAVFADTQAEPAAVYTWLDWLETQLPFPVYRVSVGNLADACLSLRTSKSGSVYTTPSLPVFVRSGMAVRQCTQSYKIEPIQRKIRSLISDSFCFQWIGISFDEFLRMKPSRLKNIKNRWPLVELRMTRQDCLDWLKLNDYPSAPRSACVFCPFHSDKEWFRLKNETPFEFQKAVSFELKYQEMAKSVSNFLEVPFFHRSLKPLDQVDFDPNRYQADLFVNECEGVCGV